MTTYSEIRQRIVQARKRADDAINAIMEAPDPTDEMRVDIRATIAAQLAASQEETEFLLKEAASFAEQIDLDCTPALYRSHRYSFGGYWHTYYEECRIIERKPSYLVVISQDFNIPGFYRGGKFRVKRDDLNLYGRSYHSRHGDYFYVAELSDREPLPTSAVLGSNKSQPEPGSMVLGTPHR
jgi:hypothetical protein